MKILFLTLIDIRSIEERGIYQDLLRKFRNEGHELTIVSPVERRTSIKTNMSKNEGITHLQVKTLNITKSNLLEKGLGTLAIEYQYLTAIKKHLKDYKFDLILYSTPPITLVKVIEFIKRKDQAYSYLLLKDIFPQNAVDMNFLKKGSFLHSFFEKKEKRLYEISDSIGCMSPANVDFILKNNPQIDPSKVEVNPNSIEPVEIVYDDQEKARVLRKYDLPINKKIFVYGGNLGVPQGLDFLLKTIETNNNKNVYFLIVGEGTELKRIEKWFDKNSPQNAKLIKRLPKDDYDILLASCDIGLIFLNKNFSIPNFPSRLLSYLEMKKPIIAATDENTDIGDIIETNKCGYKVISGDLNMINKRIDDILVESVFSEMQSRCWQLLQHQYLIENSYSKIIEKLCHV